MKSLRKFCVIDIRSKHKARANPRIQPPPLRFGERLTHTVGRAWLRQARQHHILSPREVSVFAVVNHLHLSIPVDQLRASVESEGLPLLSSLPGFRGFYFVKAAEDRAIVVILWDNAADADNGAKTFGPTWFATGIAPHLASEQQRSVGPVLVHS
jgi:hypothetical protein